MECRKGDVIHEMYAVSSQAKNAGRVADEYGYSLAGETCPLFARAALNGRNCRKGALVLTGEAPRARATVYKDWFFIRRRRGKGFFSHLKHSAYVVVNVGTRQSTKNEVHTLHTRVFVLLPPKISR